jgi:hypothetical protein
MLDNYMKQLIKELELEENLGGETPGIFTLPVEEDVSVTFAEMPPGFRLSCNIEPYKKQHEEEFLTRLMLGNLFGQATKGAVLGLNDDGSQLTLTQLVDYNVDYKEFKDILEDFINSIDYWRMESKNYK